MSFSFVKEKYKYNNHELGVCSSSPVVKEMGKQKPLVNTFEGFNKLIRLSERRHSSHDMHKLSRRQMVWWLVKFGRVRGTAGRWSKITVTRPTN
jgi:hypothetical protein